MRLEETKSAVVAFDDGVPYLGQVVTATTGAREEPQAHPMQGTVFVATDGALLRTRGGRLRVEKGDELLANMVLKRVRQIICVGWVGITTTLLHRVTQIGIDLLWLHGDTRYAARLMPLSRGDAQLRLTQYAVASDDSAALEIARKFVAGKIANMRVGLMRAACARRTVGVSSRMSVTLVRSRILGVCA